MCSTFIAFLGGIVAKSSGWGKSFLQNQKRVLETKQSECLEQQKQALGGLAAIDRDELKDPTDLANAILEQEIPLRQARGCTKQIFKVSRAILAIKNGTYGICENCNKPLPIKRLKAIPEATKCISCQQAEELR